MQLLPGRQPKGPPPAPPRCTLGPKKPGGGGGELKGRGERWLAAAALLLGPCHLRISREPRGRQGPRPGSIVGLRAPSWGPRGLGGPGLSTQVWGGWSRARSVALPEPPLMGTEGVWGAPPALLGAWVRGGEDAGV